MIPFNKRLNALRRLDEAEPQRARLRPRDELLFGGFSAELARRRRHAKSRRKASLKLKRRWH